MTKPIGLILGLAWVLLMSTHALAQKPYWINQLPTSPKNANYYYRVTSAEASDYEKAYTKAFAMALFESRCRLGIAMDKIDGISAAEAIVTENITIIPDQMRLQLNKVCEYIEKSVGSRDIKIYILWQVASYGNVDPQFDEFSRCN